MLSYYPGGINLMDLVQYNFKDAEIIEYVRVIIDKSLQLTDGDFAICYLDGKFRVKRVRLEPDE